MNTSHHDTAGRPDPASRGPALPDAAPLLELRGVRKSFPRPDGGELLVLDGIDLTLREGEVIGLLGRSGSGKSTLLRLIAGLAAPVAGSVTCLGQEVAGPPPGVAMVFQSAALFPWLTVLENVQLGLEALCLPPDEIRRRSLDAIDLIGLDGFESAYPRELSGGMRQRVGFARALVVHPAILLMDEPFSALDVLTAETLRTDFLDLWAEGQLPIRGVILVTHNIEEAVLMCDRILVFGCNPGRILKEIAVDLPQPRVRLDPGFRDIVERLYVEMTTAAAVRAAGTRTELFPGAGIGTVLPPVSSNMLAGLIEAVAGPPYDGKADLPVIAASLNLEIDRLFPVAETLQMLRFAEMAGGDITLTPEGKRFADADTDARKHLFAQHLLTYVALAAHIRRVLDERPGHRAPWHRFLDELEDHMSPRAGARTLRTVIDLGRYAEIFAYDDRRRVFSLDNP
ncbi:AAA-associated domain-containing protein [Pseudochelatococcus lubricantis]|uniref:ABC transporter ATP-binding protein n=1 Tax=Pseudochelatococcus lubricantis TaxID=1538102 RepID=UPI0035EED5DE